jgi:hypothetical protein
VAAPSPEDRPLADMAGALGGGACHG